GVSHLRLHAGVAEIELGRDAIIPEPADHRLVVGKTAAVHDQHDHRTLRVASLVLAEGGERGLQPRDADREAGRRHILLQEAADEPIIAAAAANGAEADRAAILVLHLEGEIGFEDGARVVLETTNDRWINTYSAGVTRAVNDVCDRAKV